MNLKRKKTRLRWLSLGLSILLFFQAPLTLWAAATTDGTMGAVTTLSGNFTVPETLGTRAGNNLFHSFSEFNINPGESATFTGAATIQNVISRVTGGGNTTIDGLLKSEIGNANFYFLNPNGVVFGANAAIDVPAAFHASTADVLRFSDGTTFSANINGGSTLTMASPKTFGFLDDMTAEIVVDGAQLAAKNGQPLSLIGGNITIKNSAKVQAPSGRLNVVAVAGVGEVELLPNDVTTPVAAKGNVTLESGGQLDVSGAPAGRLFLRSRNLTLTGSGSGITSASTGASNAGDLNIKVDDTLAILSGANILSRTSGRGDGATIDLQARSLRIHKNGSALDTGIWTDSLLASVIYDLDVLLGIAHPYDSDLEVYLRNPSGSWITLISHAGGDGSHFYNTILDDEASTPIESGVAPFSGFYRPTERLSAFDGQDPSGDWVLGVVDWAQGDQGILHNWSLGLNGEEWVSPDVPYWIPDNGQDYLTSILTIPESGKGGDIRIQADQVDIIGAVLETSTSGSGDAGHLTLRADALTLDGDNAIPFTGINASTFGSGDAGQVDIQVSGPLHILSGATILAETWGSGNGGQLSVQAGTLTIENLENPDWTGMSSIAYGSATGNAGDLNVTVNGLLQILDGEHIPITGSAADAGHGGWISANTYGAGQGGNLTVRAENLTLRNAPQHPENTLAWISAISTGAGDAGTLKVEVDGHLQLTGGIIATDTGGSGNGGNLRVRAGTLTLDKENVLSDYPAGIVSRAVDGSSGDHAGNITVQVDGFLQVRNGAEISARTLSTVDAGQINVNADQVLLDGGTVSSASTLTAPSAGDPGQITMDAYDTIGLLNGGKITTAAENSPASGGSPDAGSIILSPQNMLYLLNSEITTSIKGGGSNGGNIDIPAKTPLGYPGFVILNQGTIQANAYGGNGGNINIFPNILMVSADSVIEASSKLAKDGEIKTTGLTDLGGALASLSGSFLDTNPQMPPACAVKLQKIQTSTLTIGGRGGVPIEPNSWWLAGIGD